MIPRPFANTLSLLETFVSRRKARLFSPRSCLTAQLKLANRKFCPIALSGKVCHSEGGGWRVCKATATARRWWLLGVGGGRHGGCSGVSRESPKHQEFYILYQSKASFLRGGDRCHTNLVYLDWGACWRWQGQFENGCKPRCCCNDAKRLWHQTQLTQVYDKSVGKRDLDSERPANH